MTAVLSKKKRGGAVTWTFGALLLGALALRLLPPYAINASYLLLAISALGGPKFVIRALLLSWFFTMVNPAIAGFTEGGGSGRYLVLLSSFAVMSTIFIQRGAIVRTITLKVFLFSIFILLHSAAVSQIPLISTLKAISWTIAALSLLSAWHSLSPAERGAMTKEVFRFLTVVLFASFLISPHPIAYLTNGYGLQGVLNQPQAFGVTLAMLASVVAITTFSEPRLRLGNLLILGLCLVGILLSEARTAGLALVLGISSAVVLRAIFTGRIPLAKWLTSWKMWVIFLLSLVAIAFGSDAISSYVFKRDGVEEGSLVQIFIASRSILFLPMIENINNYFWTGIGFGIPSDFQNVATDPLLGVPTSLPTEKGTLPIMILEELGIVGFLLSVWLVFVILRSSAKNGMQNLSLCCTVFFINLGEASFFSSGGAGLLTWILIGWAVSGPALLQKSKRPSPRHAGATSSPH